MYKRISLLLVAILVLTFSFESPPPIFAKEIGEVKTSGGALNVRSEPKEGSTIVGRLANGAKVDILGKVDSWYKIQFSTQEAFVHQQFIHVHKQAPPPPPKPRSISIYVNDQLLQLPFEPVNDEGRLLVPFRIIGEALGIDVDWDDNTRQVISKDKDKTVIFNIDNPNTIVNGEIEHVTPAPRIVQDRTIIPLRFFAETFLADVGWDDEKREVTIFREIEEIEKPENEGEPKETEEEMKEPKDETPIEVIDEKVAGATFSGEVNVRTLNVRSAPSVSSPLLGTLSQGAMIKVKGFSGEWIQFDFEGKDAFVHSHYLNLYNGENVKTFLLSQPKVTNSEKRATVTWSKVGGEIESNHLVEESIISIISTALKVDEVKEALTGVKEITYNKTNPGTQIDIVLEDGYKATVLHSAQQISVTITSGSTKGLAGKKIMIDAGHGGRDVGAAHNSLMESELVLDISLKVQQLLEQLGVTVVMTRDTDVFLSLAERVELANSANVDAFVSIHANSAANTAAKGTETYWNSTYVGEESKRLATAIQKQLLEKLKTVDRGVKQANFQVIRQTRMPSVLVEVGFISNEEEAKRMLTQEFRVQAAHAIVDGLVDYYK